MGTRNIYLNQQHFVAMLAAALAVHMVLGIVLSLLPSMKVQKIPVHVLNIKLGGGDTASTSLGDSDSRDVTVRRVISQVNPSSPAHENIRAKSPKPPLLKKPDAPKVPEQQEVDATPQPRPEGVATIGTQAASQASNGQPSQYVRGNGNARGVAGGSVLGNSVDPQADVMHRYTQLISMWVEKHKAILNRALQPGMKGNVVFRLIIDRLGNIHYVMLDKGTGVPIVDAAALEMVRAANPVPPVPSNYPGGNRFQFLISVSYSFK